VILALQTFMLGFVFPSMEKSCPICEGEMKKIASASEMPSIPFIKIPDWIKEMDVYECQKCHFVGMWHESK